MGNLNFFKLFYGLMLVMVSTAFVSCVDDNDDTEAPYLEVSPTTLTFGIDGQPTSGSQATFDISTNRSWKATVKEEDSWVTLSKDKGEGSATIEVSIPEGINDEATVVIEISNKVGPLMSKTLIIKSGETVTPVEIYKETVGSAAVSDNPAVGVYTGWDNKVVTYSGTNTTVRSTQSNAGGYEGASGPNNILFGTAPGEFIINQIPLAEEHTNLKLTFGSIYVKDYDNKDYTFDTSKFEVYLSGDGTAWVPLTYSKNNGDAEKPNWIFATANFTLKQAVSSIYIKFKALDASKYRVDDITLSTGSGGTIIDLGSSEPSVFTADATAITATSATLGGSVTNVEPTTLTEVGVQYIAFSTGTVNDINWTAATKTAAAAATSPWTVALTNLTNGTQYAFRGYAKTASGEIFGQPKTFVAAETAFTPITLANLISKMTDATAGVAVDNDYEIEGVICSDPAGKNYSYGTLYIMTKGATTAGNALSLYNNKIDVTQYKLGQEIKVTLQKDVAKIYKRYDIPQVEGFSTDNIEVVSENNAVTPIKVTVAQLASFVCMPVTIENATIATGGIWKEPTILGTHTFNVSGTNFIISVNKGATPFDDQPFKAGTGSLTGIASIFSGAGQLAPRNLDDVKAFASSQPMIVSTEPSSVNFSSVGGSQTIEITTVNQGSNTLSISPLSGILSAKLENGKVIVTATANESNSDINQTLTITITNGNSVTVPIKVSAKGGSDTKGTFTSMTPFLFDSGTNNYNAYGQLANTDIYCLKLGTSPKSGSFTTGALGVNGNKKFSFYAAAWKGKKATIYIQINNGGSISGGNSIAPAANDGATGNPTYTITFTDSDYYTFNLTGLTESSTITIATDSNFNNAAADDSNARAIMCGFQLY